MQKSVSRLLAATAIAAAAPWVQPAKATEGVAGRYIPGAFAGPGAGIVPPVPGAYWRVSNIYYHGEISGEVPFGNKSVALRLDGDIWATVLAGVYVLELDLPGNWTYAVQATIPVGWTGAGSARSRRGRKSAGLATSRSHRSCSAGTTMQWIPGGQHP